MHADVHEYAEVDHVPHRSGEHHAWFQVLHVQHIGAEDGRRQVAPQVASGLHQLLHHVPQCGHAHADLFGYLCLAHGLHLPHQSVHRAPAHVFVAAAAQGQQLLRRPIALRVYAGVVQHVFALRHPQKARALLIGLGPQLRYLQKPLPVGECAVLLAVRDDIFRRCAVQARDALQK